ncbi:protein of unknown function (DU1801) [Tenacibaculum sp. MAR_2009_124]|uniref:DUF1801 domain-containing protein n=1 Tax=Tenacibaculum sp. MAR_2009_124 TaxID=1250059 RepID=UPI00089614A5|nr:DUF1801 domain-containing protein [Tenacibaculum sp. MAR_2009_124]SEB81515.1 protein of unknown function (DU1801) [Tenacibaculum sp. MAR_2009_124]
MSTLTITSHPEVALIFKNYPEKVKKQMQTLRELVLKTAEELEQVSKIEETLKWGEPSYVTKTGSTLRMDWKVKTPEQYAMYFQCSSRLVETFKVIFPDSFSYEGKRAIVFQLDEEIPKEKLKHCIKSALLYHKVKHLPTLGI